MLPCWRDSVSGVGGSGSEDTQVLREAMETHPHFAVMSTCQRYEVCRPVSLKTVVRGPPVVRVSSPGGPLRFYCKNCIKTQNE
jgi:hypothetical protein